MIKKIHLMNNVLLLLIATTYFIEAYHAVGESNAFAFGIVFVWLFIVHMGVHHELES